MKNKYKHLTAEQRYTIDRLLRQYIPKGSDFRSISDDMLRNIIIKINKRPRLKLNFSTPVAEFFKYIG